MSADHRPRLRLQTLAMVAALHALVIGALLHFEPVARAVGLERPILVSLVEPPSVPPQPPRPRPPKPEPRPRTAERNETLPPPPILTATPTAPAVVEAPPSPPQPPLPAVLPAPEPAAPEPAAAAPPPPAPAVVPPRFDADYLDNPAPAYPALSRRLGEQGRVLVRVYVLPDGSAGEVQLRESSGYERLDRVAVETVRRWRFVPARQGERAVAAWVLVPISFNLRS